MSFLLTVVIILSVVLLYRYYRSSRQQGRKVPGPKGYPIVGSALQLNTTNIREKFYGFARQYGSIFEIQIFRDTTLVLNSIDMIHKAFHRDGRFFSDRPRSFLAEHINLQESIVFRNPDKGHGYAKGSFLKGLRVYGNGVRVIGGEIDRLVEQIEGFNGQEFEVTRIISRSFINVMSMLLIGEEATEENANHFAELSKTTDMFLNPLRNMILTHLPVLLNIPFYKRPMDRVFHAKQKLVDKYFYGVQEAKTDDNIRGLVDWYFHDKRENFEAKSVLTDDMMKASILNDVFLAGVITSSATLSSMILCLVNHPEYQTKLQEEIDKAFGENRDVTAAEEHDCPFVEAVIMETMRYITPLPFLAPHVCSKDTEFEGFSVKANTKVFGNAWYVHHDENIWGDPWTFRPERFLGEDGQLLPKTHPHMKSWIPFGISRRQCAGMALATTRLFLYLTSLFQRLTFLPSPGKCGSCDPKGDSFVSDLLVKPKPFYCIAKIRH